MVQRIFSIAIALCLAAVSLPLSAADVKAQQNELKSRSHTILSELYKAQPSAKSAVAKAAGYATFSNFGMKIFLAGGGKGEGVAINNKTKKATYMKMVEIQAGLGLGIKKFSVIFVFDTQSALDQFINSGWEFGGQATAAAKSDAQGGAAVQGAAAVSNGVWMYQLTDAGLAAEITLKSTKFYKDTDLN